MTDLRALAGLLAAPALLAQSQGTFYAAYQDGLDAEQRGDWAAAAAAYRRAIELRPASAERVVIYGNNLLTRYYPYTRLARVEVELGQREPALAALAQAAAHGEPSTEPERLKRRLAPTPQPAAKAATLPQPSALPSGAPAPPPPTPVPSPGPGGISRPGGPSDSVPVPPAASGAPSAVRTERREHPSSEPAPPPRAGTLPAEPPVPAPARSSLRWFLAGGGALLLAGATALLRRRRRPSPGSSLPERVGPYRVERLLGHGGFASTYLARSESGTSVALKVLHPYRQDDREFLLRFRQEARLGARLDHPNLVRILDPGPEEGTPYLAMEYAPGGTLDQRLKAGPVPVAEACALALGVARAIAHAHAHGVVHRDLKPGNILITEAGPRVTDFGIARVMDSATVTTTYAFLGTPLYAAPEAQLRTHVGPAADRYSLGVILYHMLASAPPFQGETPFQILDAHRAAPVPDLAVRCPAAPPALVALVRGLLAKDPDQRPGDEDLLRVLECLAEKAEGPEAGASRPSRLAPG